MHTKCSWEADTPLQYLYNSPRVIGDVLYNCSTGADENAETAVGVSDSRSETTSISESISVEMSLGFLGLEKSSVEFKAFTGQSQGFSQEVKVTNAVEVPPGFKGWTEASVLSAGVTGSAYITQGIHLIRVSDIDLQFPGYQPKGSGGKAPVVYSGFSQAMTADEDTSRCGAVGPGTGNGAQGARAARQAAARTERFKLTVCHPRSTKRSGRRCAARTVTGVRPPAKTRVTATLERGGRVYARERDRRGGIRLTQHRDITPGRYRWVIREKPRNIVVRDHGRRLHRAVQHMITIVPVTIRWTRRK
jgi:hypothetical protein